MLLYFLTQYDCVTFYSYLESVRSTPLHCGIGTNMSISAWFTALMLSVCSYPLLIDFLYSFLFARSSGDGRAFSSHSTWAFMEAANTLFVVGVASVWYVWGWISNSLQKSRERVFNLTASKGTSTADGRLPPSLLHTYLCCVTVCVCVCVCVLQLSWYWRCPPNGTCFRWCLERSTERWSPPQQVTPSTSASPPPSSFPPLPPVGGDSGRTLVLANDERTCYQLKQVSFAHNASWNIQNCSF